MLFFTASVLSCLLIQMVCAIACVTCIKSGDKAKKSKNSSLKTISKTNLDSKSKQLENKVVSDKKSDKLKAQAPAKSDSKDEANKVRSKDIAAKKTSPLKPAAAPKKPNKVKKGLSGKMKTANAIIPNPPLKETTARISDGADESSGMDAKASSLAVNKTQESKSKKALDDDDDTCKNIESLEADANNSD